MTAQSEETKQEVPKVGDIASFRNYLLQRFNDYEVALSMSAQEVRELIVEFYEEYIHEYNKSGYIDMEKQKIQGKEKQEMDQRFRDQMKLIREQFFQEKVDVGKRR